MFSRTPTRRDLLRWIGAVGACAAVARPSMAAGGGLAAVMDRGTLKVGIYDDMPPFHAKGKGIDVELAQALADSLGVKLSLLPFHADDNMADDLRNMVWRGHYLGYGPADVMMHVPVDRPLMQDNPQVSIFAPYYQDRVMIARRLERLPHLETLAQLGDRPVAVAGLSLAGWLMLGADGGAYRQQVTTHWKDGVEAAQALHRGEVAAAAGLASELETVLRGDDRFAITPVPLPRAPRDGWAVGLAVKRDATDLAQRLGRAVNELAADGGLRRMFEKANVGWRAG